MGPDGRGGGQHGPGRVHRHGPEPETALDLFGALVAGAGLALVNGSAFVFLALLANYLGGSMDHPIWIVPVAFVMAWALNVVAAMRSQRAAMWTLWAPTVAAMAIFTFGGIFI